PQQDVGEHGDVIAGLDGGAASWTGGPWSHDRLLARDPVDHNRQEGSEDKAEHGEDQGAHGRHVVVSLARVAGGNGAGDYQPPVHSGTVSTSAKLTLWPRPVRGLPENWARQKYVPLRLFPTRRRRSPEATSIST